MKVGYNKFCSNLDNIKIKQEAIVTTCLLKYGVMNPSQIPEVKKKISDTKKYQMSLLSEDDRRLYTQKARVGITFESSIEKRVKKCLVDLGEEFLSQPFLWGYNFDVMLRDKILIEVNGDFWHANPQRYKESDILLKNLTAKDIWDKDRKKMNKATNNG